MLNNVDFNRLKIFYYIYTLETLAAAAYHLHLTPSAISQQLTKLEKELGVQLFVRQHKKLIPSSEAGILAERIEPFIQGLEADLKFLTESKTKVCGHLRIGSPTEFGISHFSRMIASFQKEYPQVTFSIFLENTVTLLGMLKKGEIDFAVADLFSTKQVSPRDLRPFAVEALLDESFFLACSTTYYQKNVEEQKFGFDLLAEQKFVAYDNEFRNLRAWFHHHFRRQPPRFDIALTIDSVQAVVHAIENDIGLGVVTCHSIEKQVEAGEIVVIKTGREEIINKISLVQLQDKIPSFTERKFLAHIGKLWHNK